MSTGNSGPSKETNLLVQTQQPNTSNCFELIMYKRSTTITSGNRTTITQIRCPAYKRSFLVVAAGKILHDIVKTSSRFTIQ